MKRLPQYYRCGECEEVPACRDCIDCSESYCQPCFDTVHSRGMRANHTNRRPIYVCLRCNGAPATVACPDCDGRYFCDRCNTRLHGPKGKLKKHQGIMPVKQYFQALQSKAAAVNRDMVNAFHLQVPALVASPNRFAGTANLASDPYEDAEAAAALVFSDDDKDEEQEAAPQVEEEGSKDTKPNADDTDATPKDTNGEPPQQQRPSNAGVQFQEPSKEDTKSSSESTTKQAAEAANTPETAAGLLQSYVDPDTAQLQIGGEDVADRIWGWLRLSKLFPDGALFDVGNTALRTKFDYPAPVFPALNAPDVAEALGAFKLGDDVPAINFGRLAESLPRFPRRPSSIALNDSAFNFALLGLALCGTPAPLARLFHSVEHRDVGMYSLQFFDSCTRPERLQEVAREQGVPVSEHTPARAARQAPRSPKAAVEDDAADPSTKSEKPDPLSPGPLPASYAPMLRAAPPLPDPRAPLPPQAQDESLTAAAGHQLTVSFAREVFWKQDVVVTIDDLIPITREKKPLFGLTEYPSERWKVLVEKAWAKVCGTYAALEATNPVPLAQALSGGRITAETWAGRRDVAAVFPTAEAGARFVWWKVRAAKAAGQIVWLTHRKEHAIDLPTVDVASDPTSTEPASESIPADGSPTGPDPGGLTMNEAQRADAAAAAAGKRADAQAASLRRLLNAGWGTEDWAVAEGRTAELEDAAVALHTMELSLRAANGLGIRRSAASVAPSPEGWQLTKLNQLGGDYGAERFSFAHFSGSWSKDLREYFDFRGSDSDVCCATPEDLADAFDTVTTCSNYVGAPPSACILVAPTDAPEDAMEAAPRVLIITRPGVTSLSLRNAAAFDLHATQSVPATKALDLRLWPVEHTPSAFFDIQGAHRRPIEESITVQPVVAMNRALGTSHTLPDQFMALALPAVPPTEDPSAIGRAYVMSVCPRFHKDATSVVLAFDTSEVMLTTVL